MGERRRHVDHVVRIQRIEFDHRPQLEVERVAAAKKKEHAAKLAASVLTLLDARGIDIDDESRTKIMTCENPSELKTWLLNAATAESTREVFAAVIESSH